MEYGIESDNLLMKLLVIISFAKSSFGLHWEREVDEPFKLINLTYIDTTPGCFALNLGCRNIEQNMQHRIDSRLD